MTEFITRVCHAKNEFEIIIKTDNEEHFEAAQWFARRLIDHAKPFPMPPDNYGWIPGAVRTMEGSADNGQPDLP